MSRSTVQRVLGGVVGSMLFRRAPMLTAVGAAALLVAVAACSSDAELESTSGPAPTAEVSASIPAGAQAVPVSEPLVITAQHGRIATIQVTDAAGAPLGGQIDPTGGRWTSSPLAWGTSYQVRAQATMVDGRPGTALESSFSTAGAPSKTVAVDRVRPDPGQVIGVAMPVTIWFDRPVTDRAAVQRRLSIATSVPTEGSWSWFDDDEVHWRPKEYWKAGTQVTVSAKLYGVDTGGGVFGESNFETRFSIGRDQRVFGDVNTFHLKAYVDGVEVRNMPASYGRGIYPTQYGIHVAYEKHRYKRMRSDTWGGAVKGQPDYYDEILPHAIRVSANGEFVHTNAASTWAQGERNVSHGCINLSPENGAWFYDFVQMGDPVEIVGSTRPLTRRDGDIADWVIPWDEYVAGSALPPAAAGPSVQYPLPGLLPGSSADTIALPAN